jgi:hypothetical protein
LGAFDVVRRFLVAYVRHTLVIGNIRHAFLPKVLKSQILFASPSIKEGSATIAKRPEITKKNSRRREGMKDANTGNPQYLQKLPVNVKIRYVLCGPGRRSRLTRNEFLNLISQALAISDNSTVNEDDPLSRINASDAPEGEGGF